jgi:hypothetical protein
MPKAKSRPYRWAEAARVAQESLYDLVEMQQEYQDWLDGLPEGLDQSATAEKLQSVCDIPLDEVVEAIEEADTVELPLGFGRD